MPCRSNTGYFQLLGVNLVTLIPGQDPKRMDHIVSAFDQLIRVKVEKVS